MRQTIVHRHTAVVLFLLAALAACKTEQKAQPAAPAAPAPTPMANAFTVHAKDFSFSAPDTVPAGLTNITLVNDGPSVHHVQLIKLDSGKTAADFGAAMKANKGWPMWAAFASGPNAAMPGGSSMATVDLAAGNYLMICLVDVPDRIPHFMKGMTKTLTVTPNSAPQATMPKADVQVNTAEYTFALSDTVRSGTRVFEVHLVGAQPHEVVLFKLAPGKTAKDFGAWGATYKGPPPGELMGGAAVAPPGATVQFTANVTPGNYLMVCFVPDAKDQKPHIEHGMITTFTVN